MTNVTEELLAQRGAVYGDAINTHERIAAVWTGILNREVNAHEVALCMTGLKLVRSSCSPNHEDNLEDVLGYATIAQRIIEDGRARAGNP